MESQRRKNITSVILKIKNNFKLEKLTKMKVNDIIKDINTIPKMPIEIKNQGKSKVKTSEIYKIKPHLSAKEINAIYRLTKLIQAEKNLSNKRQ